MLLNVVMYNSLMLSDNKLRLFHEYLTVSSKSLLHQDLINKQYSNSHKNNIKSGKLDKLMIKYNLSVPS